MIISNRVEVDAETFQNTVSLCSCRHHCHQAFVLLRVGTDSGKIRFGCMW